jgi:SNF2 family DNA or RNA helicase
VYVTFSQKLLAHELTLAHPSHDAQKLTRSLNSAQVDLNPHQIDAALFAFCSPLSRGAILADEVGLGKTIEAGLVISQLWAEGKKKILLLLPASIRKQWQNELWDKFSLPSLILDSTTYRGLKKEGQSNPFRIPQPIITSIARTVGSLIDQIVYRLYGLADEEIKIVEGGATSQKLY